MTVKALWVQATEYNAVDDRGLFAAILPPGTLGSLKVASGVRRWDDFGLTVAADGRGATVGTGMAWVKWNDQVYLVGADAPETLALTPADATNPRVDRIVVQVYDSEQAGADRAPQVRVITGTPSANPTPPALPPSVTPLYRLRFSAGSTAPQVTNDRVAAAAGATLHCQHDRRQRNSDPDAFDVGTGRGNMCNRSFPSAPPGWYEFAAHAQLSGHEGNGFAGFAELNIRNRLSDDQWLNLSPWQRDDLTTVRHIVHTRMFRHTGGKLDVSFDFNHVIGAPCVTFPFGTYFLLHWVCPLTDGMTSDATGDIDVGTAGLPGVTSPDPGAQAVRVAAQPDPDDPDVVVLTFSPTDLPPGTVEWADDPQSAALVAAQHAWELATYGEDGVAALHP